jgi:hypothetical protein
MATDNTYTPITNWDVTAITDNSRTPTAVTAATTWEYYHTDYEVEDLKRRVRLLENELATTKERCINLECFIMRLDGEFHEMKDSIWFRYIDIK